MKVFNLDSILEEDQIIEVDGKQFRVPGELPTGIVLKLVGVSQDLLDNPESIELWNKQLNLLHKIFLKRNPDMTLEDFKDTFTAKQIGRIIQILLKTLQEVEEPEKKTLQKEENQKVQTPEK